MNKIFLLSTSCAALLVLPTNLYAQGSSEAEARTTQDRGIGVEDIVVTAQKREQSLQDVPVAVTALTENMIQANRITNIQDLSGLAPNVVIRPAAGGSAVPTFSMRGITSYGVVPGSDKQVSINLDGVYISATRGAVFELPDIARIEVLRGPQGTLFGRNATAGAVSIVTREPSGVMAGRFEAGIGNYDQRRVRFSVETPKVGPFSAYLSFVSNKRRGDVRNLGAGTRWDRSGSGTFDNQKYDTDEGVQYSPEYLGSKDVDTYFAALKFEPSSDFKLVYRFDLADDHSTPEANGVVAINTSASGGAGGVIIGALANNQPIGGGPFGPIIFAPSGKRPKEVNNFWTTPSHLKNLGHSLTLDFQAADNLSVRSITAYRKAYLNAAISQVGGLGGLVLTEGAVEALAPVYIPNYALIPEANRPAALAGLAASFGGLGSRLVDVGINVQNESKQWSQEFQFNYQSDLVNLTIGGIYFRSDDRSGPSQFTRTTSNLTFMPATGEVPLGQTGVSYNYATSIAGYAQAELHLSDAFDLVLGGRLTNDKKNGSYFAGLTPAGVTTGTFIPTRPDCPATSNPVGECRFDGIYQGIQRSSFDYSDTRFIYSIGFNYQPHRDFLGYVKYSTGYVSGGSIGGVAFKPETVKSWEGGIKADFFDRRVRTNLALFYAQYKDVQTSQSGRNVGRPDLGTAIITGLDEKTYGFEVEATFVPVEGLTLGSSLGYTHIKYENISGLLLSSVAVPGSTTTEYLPNGTPKWTGNLYANYETPPIFGDATLYFHVDGNWRSSLRANPNPERSVATPQFAPVDTLPSRWLLNSRVALRNIPIGPGSLEFAVWGRNLTDDKSASFPLVTPFMASTSYQAARTYGLEVIMKY